MLRNKICSLGIALLLVLSVSSCSGAQTSSNENNAQNNISNTNDLTVGYIDKTKVIDSIALLNTAPSDNSDAKTLDITVARAMQTLYGKDRWIQASSDGDDFTSAITSERPEGCQQFECQIGININETDTPFLLKVLTKLSIDGGNAGAAAKNKYNQVRPFVKLDNHETCRPQDEKFLSTNGSYPSGHTIEGWLWGSALIQADSDDASEIAVRARQYSESRLVCNAHWLTDIQAGRDLAAMVFADVQQSSEFRNDIEQAKHEIVAAKAKKEVVQKDWAATVDAVQEYVNSHPEDAKAKETLNLIQPLRSWNCEKELAALTSVDISEFIGR